MTLNTVTQPFERMRADIATSPFCVTVIRVIIYASEGGINR